VIGVGAATMFVIGAGFLFGIVFLPLFLVNVVGVSATRAGLVMMPLTLGVVAGSIASGQLVTRLGRYRGVLLGGLGLLVAAFALMALAVTPDATPLRLTLLMVASGLGLGPTMPLYTLAMQNAAPGRDVGVVTALATFSRSLGQVIGVAALGAVFAATLAGAMARETGAVLATLPPAARAAVADAAPVAAPEVSAEEGAGAALALDTAAVRARLRTAPLAPADRDRALAAVPALQHAVGVAFSRATARLYLLGAAIVVVALLLTLRIPDRPLRAHTGDAPHVALE
jgi:MFS family permease